MAKKSIDKKQVVKKLSRQIKIPPGRIIVSKKDKKAQEKRSDWKKAWQEMREEE